jgi:hypothetical protein
LAASLAHEILHPIATTRNNARAGMRYLEMTTPNLPKVKEALACIVRDADRGKAIVDRMRDHVRKAPAQSEPFDLNEAIQQVIEMVQSAVINNKISVRSNLNGLLPVHGDRVELQQVVLNLILNAVEAMSSVGTTSRELSISTTQGQTGDIVIAVQDTGPGIEPERIDQVFAPFYTTKKAGIGMGLSICCSRCRQARRIHKPSSGGFPDSRASFSVKWSLKALTESAALFVNGSKSLAHWRHNMPTHPMRPCHWEEVGRTSIDSLLDISARTPLAKFATNLRGDLDAIKNALATPWSTGPVEGQISKLKMIKRTIYSRAGFQLLRARTLHAR